MMKLVGAYQNYFKAFLRKVFTVDSGFSTHQLCLHIKPIYSSSHLLSGLYVVSEF